MVHKKIISAVKKVFTKPKKKFIPPPTGGQSRPSGPVIVTPSGKVVGTAKPPTPSPPRRRRRGGGGAPTGGQSRPSGPVIVTPSGKVVGTAKPPTPSPPRRPSRIRRELLFTPLPKKDIITPLERARIIKKERAAKFKRKFIPTISKDVGKERREKFKTFIKKEIGFNFYEKEANKRGDKIFNEVSSFGDNRLNFYQGEVNAGRMFVGEADRRIQIDVARKQGELINKDEFFREKNSRKPTTNSVSFQYETDRLKAIREGDKRAENVSLFLRIAADTPSSLVKLGGDATKGITKLFNDPQAREDSIEKIKETFTIEKAKALPKKIEVKATEITKFALTSPSTAIAVIGGVLVSFALIGGAVSKVGKPVLRLTGIVSKNTSKGIIKNLKFDPFVKQGLKDVGKISIEISPKILARVGQATRTGRPLKVSSEATRRLVKSFNQSIKKSKLGTRAKKISQSSLRIKKKLSRQRIRNRKRILKRRIKNIRFVKGVRIKVKKVSTAKERLIIKKRLKKRRKEKEKLRALLKRKAKEEAKEKRFKASELGRGVAKVRKIPRKIKRKVVESRRGVAVKKLSRRLKKRKVRIVQRKRLIGRRKEKLKRRKVLIRQEKFRKSRLGKFKVSVSKKIKKLDSIIKKFETPSAKLVFPRAKTPLSKTFPREFKLKINDKAVERFVRKQVKLRGFNFDKLSGIEKNFLIGQVKARIRNNPSKFIPKERRLALERFKGKKPKKIPRKEIKIKIQGGELTITKIKPTKPTKRRTPFSKTFPEESQRGRQILLQKPKLKKPRQIIVETRIRPTELTKTQKLALLKLRKNQGKQRLIQKEVNVLKQKKQNLKTKQRIKSKSKQLEKITARSLLLFRQLEKQRITPRQAQPLRVALRQAQPEAQPLREAQAQRVARPPRLRSKFVPKVPPKRPFRFPLKIKRKKGVSKKKPTKQQAWDAFGRPLKKFKGQKQPKLIKLNKRSLSKVQAQRLGSTLADTTISRTFKIKAVKGKPKSPHLKTKSFKKRKFRDFKIRKGKRVKLKNTFIERTKFLIDHSGEKRGLTLRRGLAKLRKESRAKPIKKKKVITPNKRSELLKNLEKARAARMKNLKGKK